MGGAERQGAPRVARRAPRGGRQVLRVDVQRGVGVDPAYVSQELF